VLRLAYIEGQDRDALLAAALRTVHTELPQKVGSDTTAIHVSRNPADPEEVLGTTPLAQADDVDAAVAAALEVLETAKPWREADADVAAADALAWGPPENPAFDHGPLIARAAQEKALAYVDIGRQEGRLVWQGRVPGQGWFVPPTIVAGIRPEHRLAREEVFGPVLAVLRAPTFAAALEMANDSDYGLTGARVGVQPFGGVRLSGTGIQAGGPDYLKQFLTTRCVTENTQRHGMLPAQP
jgi:RHH-type proline utilization regulon transcriptional repressor/proline dehydrogenase/delta 1-pyrroline-5-carboxylate dehydrogenase